VARWGRAWPRCAISDEFYGLTDRVPNVDGPHGTKVELDPAIARVRLVGSDAVWLPAATSTAAVRILVLPARWEMRLDSADAAPADS
jgi:hypothetical protein